VNANGQSGLQIHGQSLEKVTSVLFISPNGIDQTPGTITGASYSTLFIDFPGFPEPHTDDFGTGSIRLSDGTETAFCSNVAFGGFPEGEPE
jgi:hypothetical protein